MNIVFGWAQVAAQGPVYPNASLEMMKEQVNPAFLKPDLIHGLRGRCL
jgi:hypothetical protein